MHSTDLQAYAFFASAQAEQSLWTVHISDSDLQTTAICVCVYVLVLLAIGASSVEVC